MSTMDINPIGPEDGGPDEGEVPVFTVTVDPHFAVAPPAQGRAAAETQVRWHECCVHWATGTVAEKLEHLPTGVVLPLGREFTNYAERHAALVQLDALVLETHVKEGECWSRADA